MPARAHFLLPLCLLACLGCGKQKSTAELISDLKGVQERDRLVAVRLLQHRQADAAQVVPALIESLKDKAVDIRLSATIGLGYYGEQAKDAIPALRAAQSDRDARVRQAAGVALVRIDPQLAPKTAPANTHKK
jgi:HEAT repeat protein